MDTGFPVDVSSSRPDFLRVRPAIFMRQSHYTIKGRTSNNLTENSSELFMPCLFLFGGICGNSGSDKVLINRKSNAVERFLGAIIEKNVPYYKCTNSISYEKGYITSRKRAAERWLL